ncbi:dienelactone hydrolase family protein [Herbiconiux daphne]|uniref:Dienelactone hydrolase family protein n=1 Tax=Herbiconiux daphne TaxID=2970914 RepID=A0ABT2H427_9MICO|nr:dienelactone hydrolase family protein [Herbiconiux daphne]MCS5734667.1 dienelactone hydrolase family protein [Herbiconiux daphne]
MSEILLFHAAYGLTPGVVAFADHLRGEGHVVHTPDYYDGTTFSVLSEGLAYRDELGMDEIVRRGDSAAGSLPPDLVYAGFSLGAVPAQKLAQTRPGARGAILLDACVPSAEFGVPWPASVPLAVHGGARDEWFEPDVAKALIEEASEGELHLYPTADHLFALNDLPTFQPDLAQRLADNVVDWLARH